MIFLEYFFKQYLLLMDEGLPSKWNMTYWNSAALFLPVMFLHPQLEKVPFAPLVDVNRKSSGGDFLEEVCFCNHKSSCWNVEVYPGCHRITKSKERMTTWSSLPWVHRSSPLPESFWEWILIFDEWIVIFSVFVLVLVVVVVVALVGEDTC